MGANQTTAIQKALDQPNNLEACKKAFEILDKDKTGTLNKEEFHHFAKKVLETDLVLFKNKEKEEISKKIKDDQIEEFVEHMYNFANEEGRDDGNVTFEDFQYFLTQHHRDPQNATGVPCDRHKGVISDASKIRVALGEQNEPSLMVRGKRKGSYGDLDEEVLKKRDGDDQPPCAGDRFLNKKEAEIDEPTGPVVDSMQTDSSAKIDHWSSFKSKKLYSSAFFVAK